MRGTEDKLAILSGFIILLLGAIPFLILPLLDVYILELIDPLKSMSVKLSKWQYNPLEAFHLKLFGIILLFALHIPGMLFT